MKFLFGSDICFHYIPEFPGKAAAERAVASVAACFARADFSMVNLETVLGVREAHNPIFKCGPNLISTADFLSYIAPLKPSVLGLANNHTGDFGESGVYETLRLLEREGYRAIGAGRDLAEAYRPFIAEKDGIRVGVIAVCENEFGGAKRYKAGSAVYQLTMLQRTIDSLKTQGCRPVVYFHGGNEYNPFPSPGKKELYRHFVDMGASAVVAMHTHCPQGYEIYNNCPIVYSMGNLFFPHGTSGSSSLLPTWYYGYLAELDFREDGTALRVIPYTFAEEGITLLEGEALERFLRYLNRLSSVIRDDEKLEAYFDAWCVLRGRSGNPSITFQESMIGQQDRNVAIARNKFTCEAHNEVWKNYYVLCYEQRLEESLGLVEEIQSLQRFDPMDENRA